MIRVSGLTQRFGGETVLRNVGFSVRQGEMYGIIGPNGSGKSTLLRALTGVEQPFGGDIRIEGKPLGSYSRKSLARILAVLEQESLPPVGFTAKEIVEMGRYPHQNWLGSEQGDPAPLIAQIMNRLGLEPLANRTLDRLSGGERQRVALGKAMAQEPRILVLDEPTTYLDIGYQVQTMDFVKAWQKECGLTVVAVLHDLNLAAMYCDRILVLESGEAVAEGVPRDLIRAELIERVYGTRPIVIAHPVIGVPQILLRSEQLNGANIYHIETNKEA